MKMKEYMVKQEEFPTNITKLFIYSHMLEKGIFSLHKPIPVTCHHEIITLYVSNDLGWSHQLPHQVQ